MDALTVRPAYSEDAPAIAHIHVMSWRDTYPGIVPQSYLDALDEREFTKRWKTRLATEEATTVCVAECEGVLCGFASGGPIRKPVSIFDGELYALYLLPTMQRKGVGLKLFAQMAEVFADRELNNLFVWLLRQNPAAGFYERLGGELVAEDTLEIGGEALPMVACGWTDLATRSWR